MKKSGILNQQLMTAITGLGHTDSFLLCDAGFAISTGIQRIDLALTEGIPSFTDCLKAILTEVVIEEIAVAKQMEQYNPASFTYVMNTFQNQKKLIIDQSDFLQNAKCVKFVVRSGELTPYANILLTAASGVEQFKRGLTL